MGDHRDILRRVGSVLVIVGIADIAYMIYCVTHGQSYSSSLNIFAVIAGVFLLRGNLGAVRYVTFFSAFMLSAAIVATLVLFPSLEPADLRLVEFRLHPGYAFFGIALAVTAIAFLLWVYRQLRSPSVVAARVAVGQSGSPPKGAFLAGALLAVGLAVIMRFTLQGDAGIKAAQLAEAKEGASYKYCVTSMNWSGDHGTARVTAYNEREIKLVEVAW